MAMCDFGAEGLPDSSGKPAEGMCRAIAADLQRIAGTNDE